MDKTIVFVAFIILLTLNISGCITTHDKSGVPPANAYGIIVPPLKFVTPEDKIQWEGEINGRSIAYFRLEKERGISNIVISTQDKLPAYFKRIEYFDDGGDGNLDLMSMNIYERDTGWRYVGITRDNKYGLAYADSQYKELLEKIKEAETVKD